MSKNKIVLLPYEQIVKAEILQAFKTVDSNFSFAAGMCFKVWSLSILQREPEE